MSETYQDGNALAGPLRELFAVDVTAAVTTCVGCGRTGQIATLQVYGGELGSVARCPGCTSVVLRYAHTPAGAWLDLRGAVSLHVPTSSLTG
jgi:pyruvate/2-oxoacid:ferredoxin oxidoreductase beta subunit